MNRFRSLSLASIGVLLVSHAGCSGGSNPRGAPAGANAAASAVTAAQLTTFNEAISAPAADLFKKDWSNEFADTLKKSLGSDKTSLDEARKIRDRLLGLLRAMQEKVAAIPTPYVPEAWAMKQSILSLLGTMFVISSSHMDDMIDVVADESLSPEEKMERCGKLHARQGALMESASKIMDEAGAAWEAYLKSRPGAE